MAIFGRITARQRLRRAAQESLAIPPFGPAVDYAPWVVGELWPAELSTITPENASVARYLRAELDKIVRSTNEQLRTIRGAGPMGPAQQAEAARVVNSARAFAAERVEAALRQLDKKIGDLPTDNLPSISAGPGDGPSAEDTQRLPIITAAPEDPADEQPPTQEAEEVAAQPESDQERLHRLVEFMARQEPGLCWAAGDQENGMTVVATDLAEGWIPPGIAVPPDVRLLPPQRRTGDVVAILGPTTISATYAPGDPLAWSFGWATELDPAAYSVRARRLPPIDGLGWLLAGATHMRDGLPRMVHTLAKAGAAKTPILETEIEELRAHLETARVQLLAQYPEVDHAVLLNCLLLAATDGIATGDRLTANYHFAWYQALNAPPPHKRPTR
ncbi:vegetative cell wall protein precursor [Mycobacterium celatum]|uniref:Vegetative cell wall protein n=2 Tax=Mycobacterium celatum TaxID=28045 RepID=A0A2G5PIS5_MYCCE|nr:DUF5631 domain-containing protein [Mycobacterium celatum]PIB78197.1 vegetative cell wall protein precursor [Mycobacterium celatum]